MALLSAPLETALPAAYPAFLQKILERAILCLSPATIRPIYQITSSLGDGKLDDIPQDLLSRLQESLLAVLRNVEVQENAVSLYSLAVLARIATHAGSSLTRQSTVSTSISSQIPLQPALQFFNKRVHKTLDLVVLKVILYCSRSCMLQPSEATDNLQLCLDTLEAIAPEAKVVWLAQNGAKAKKLCEKVLRPDIVNEVQWVALGCLITLLDGSVGELEIVSVIEKSISCLDVNSISSKAASRCLGRLDDSAICRILLKLLRVSCESDQPTTQSYHRLHNAVVVADTICELAKHSPLLYRTLSRLLTHRENLAVLARFSTYKGPGYCLSDCGSSEVCLPAMSKIQARLHQSLTFLILSSCLHEPLADDHMRETVILPLLSRQTISRQRLDHRPDHTVRIERRSISIFETRGTPTVAHVSHGWRDKLSQDMKREALSKSESMSRMIGDICRDLELRCEETERPLRDEQSRSQALEDNLKIYKAKTLDLEADADHLGFRITDLEQEKASLQEQLQTAVMRSDELSVILDEFRQEMECLKAEKQRGEQIAAESARQQDLVFLATLTGKDERYEEQTSRLHACEEQITRLEKGLMASEVQTTEAAQMAIVRQQMLDEREHALSDLQETTKTLEAEAREHMSCIEELQNTIISLRSNAETTQKENDAAKSEVETQLRFCEGRILEIQQKYDMQTIDHKAALEHFEEKSRGLTSDHQADLERIRNDADQVLKRRDLSIAELSKKTSRLRGERRALEEELTEAKEISGKLMAVFGAKSFNQKPSAKHPKSSNEQVVSDEESHPLSPQSILKHARDHIPSPSAAVRPDSPQWKKAKIHRDGIPSTRSPVALGTPPRHPTVGERRQALATIQTPNLCQDAIRSSTVLNKVSPSKDNMAATTSSGVGPTPPKPVSELSFGEGDVLVSTYPNADDAFCNYEQYGLDDDTTAEF